ncbi:MAG: tetratricopeptide repeat protein [Lentisphaerae bacterium]|nr:tetratricopeptide repeat protein [Lentisphaerota bacterium]
MRNSNIRNSEFDLASERCSGLSMPLEASSGAWSTDPLARQHLSAKLATKGFRAGVAAIVCVLMLAALPAWAAREAKVQGEAGEGDMEASRLLDKANELLTAGESERGVRMLETVVEQYPASRVRFAAYLALGRHCVNASDHVKAVSYLSNLKGLENAAEEVAPADREIYLEGMYLMGTAYFQMRNYEAAFPILRKITSNYANTVWANQAYYYIGMCHFVQQNWSKAVEALNLVGTFVDVDAEAAKLVEAGRRFYLKVTDRDLPVLVRLGKQTWAEIATTHGDREKIECIPLGLDATVLIGSIASEIGASCPGDGALQVLGGDTVTVRYTDANSREGIPNVVREAKVRVVSSGAPSFTLGDFETPASAVFLDQPLCLALYDVDLDTSDAAETATVKLISRYVQQEEEAEPNGAVDLKKILSGDEGRQYKTRDEITVKLTETGSAPVHSGRFTGRVSVQAVQPHKPANPGDDVLTCAVDDEVVVTYTDELHLGGSVAREVRAALRAVGEIDNRPRASQDVVADPLIRARKNLVEASAYLELARIFKSMGLAKGAKQKSIEGVDRVDVIIRSSSPIPSDIKQQAFKTKWELHMAAEDYQSAIATCGLFNRLYPDSPLVDEALMGIARIRIENREYTAALSVLNQILALSKSQAKAEAQFRIAEIAETMNASLPAGRERAVQQYKLCAEQYPDSEFAGRSLAKLVDYHVSMKDFLQANEVLEQVFQDYPDAAFLPEMLLQSVLVAYISGDYAKAWDKCAQILFEYPGSPSAEKAKQMLPRVEAKLKAGGGSTPEVKQP